MRKIKSFLPAVLLIIFCLYPVALFAAEESAVFAGGCFWCLEHDLENLQGVINVYSGYSGGKNNNPTYRNHSGHKEVVLVEFDSNKISYEKLLRSYWRNIDPLDDKGQFCDKGDSYMTVIFTDNKYQKSAAELSFKKAADELSLSAEEIRVQIKPRSKFWIAESYHQNYAKNNNLKYNFYRYSCGRDKRLIEIWNDKAGGFAPWD
tara:strand:- start:478 stop:1092 length:615 start_codon:yes stop_codon:yes gene_type:complete